MSARPAASSELVRLQMSRQKRRDTGPEVALRKELHARGLRFRVHKRVGRTSPDVLFPRARLAVFVMGDFWHSCPVHATSPKSNSDWWIDKLKINKARDERQRRELESDGWHVEWVWECDPPAAAADRIENLWRQRTGRQASSIDTGTPSAY